MRKWVVFSLCLISLIAMSGQAMSAENSEKLKGMLIDIDGWKAEKAEGASVNMGPIKMVNATRSYEKGSSELDISIVIGSNAMLQGKMAAADIETDDMSVKQQNIDGFRVVRSYDKKDKSGSIIISFTKTQTKGALMVLGFEGITPDEALMIAKKFDWNKIKELAEKIIK